jgi:hypothetical protein
VIAGAWRVVCEGGAAHEVSARHTPGSYGGEWRADSDGAAAGGSSARTAVLALAAGTGWPVVELVAPGEATAAERLAQAIAERDAAHVALAAAVRGYLRAVDEPTWDERSLATLDVARTALDAALAAAGGDR